MADLLLLVRALSTSAEVANRRLQSLQACLAVGAMFAAAALSFKLFVPLAA